MVTGYPSLSLWSLEESTCLLLFIMVADYLSLSLTLPWSCCMSLTVSYSCLISLFFSLIPCSCYMALTFSHCYWLSLTVHIELLHVSNFLLLLLVVPHCLPVPWSCCMSLTVSYDFWMSLPVSTSATELLKVSHCLFQFPGVSRCLSLSSIVAGCLSLSPCSCCMSLTVSYGC